MTSQQVTEYFVCFDDEDFPKVAEFIRKHNIHFSQWCDDSIRFTLNRWMRILFIEELDLVYDLGKSEKHS